MKGEPYCGRCKKHHSYESACDSAKSAINWGRLRRKYPGEPQYIFEHSASFDDGYVDPDPCGPGKRYHMIVVKRHWRWITLEEYKLLLPIATKRKRHQKAIKIMEDKGEKA